MSELPDYDDYEDDRNEQYRMDAMQDEANEEWFQEQLAYQLEEIFDGNFEAIFQAKVASWSRKRWPQAEATAFRVGREARQLATAGSYGPAVVWSATCVEIIFRDLTLKPIFVGLFLGGEWADQALDMMLGNRWVGPNTRKIAERVLREIAGVDVAALETKGLRPWGEIEKLLRTRNRIVHRGDEVTREDATWAVDVAAALYGSLVPKLRELCGLEASESYRAPARGAVP
jgi:hypothetical protein